MKKDFIVGGARLTPASRARAPRRCLGEPGTQLRCKHTHARGRTKGKGAGGGGIEAPNTLQSRSVVRIIDLLCEGPIGGLANGAKSIYFNGVPLMTDSGHYNFKGVTWDIVTGTPDQAAFQGFPSVESTFAYGVQILNSVPQYHTITNADVNRCTVTLEFPAMFVTDTHNGNINPTSVHIQIAVTPSGGTSQTVIDATVSGKNTSPYEQSWTFALPGSAPWIVEVIRLNGDSETAGLQNSTYLDSVTEIVDHNITYADSACVAITFDSELFGSTIPTRTYDIVALIVQVPANYNPATRTYATTGTGTSGGTWDGYTMVPANTDNPAWIVFDFIMNDRYGMGVSASALEATKWDLYAIAQYCDELIPDGFSDSGMVPRYTCNVCISSRADAYQMLASFTSIFRGMSYWGSGTVRITADMPGPVVKLVTQADVLAGNFAYSGTALKARHSMAIAQYIDPTNQWQPSPVLYQDQTQINANYGQNIATFAAFGATDIGQAYRAAKWLLDSETHQYDTVTYTASLDHLDIMPGEIVQIADPAYMGVRFGGRVLSSLQDGGATIIIIDGVLVTTVTSLPSTGTPQQILYDTVTSEFYVWNATTSAWVETAINTYTISIEYAGEEILLNQPVVNMVTPTGSTTQVIIEPALASLPPAGAQWTMQNTEVEPREFRIIGISEPQRGQIQVTALMHDPTKYERIEYGIYLQDVPYSSLPINVFTDDIGPPSNVTANDYYVGEGTTTVLRTTISWTPSTDARVLSYNVEIGGDTGYTNTLSNLAGPSTDIDNLPVGNYVFGVQGVTAEGRLSSFALSPKLLINGQPIAPAAPLGFTAVGGTRLVTLSWEAVTASNLYYYELWRAPGTHGAFDDTVFSLLAQVSATSYTDSESTVLVPLSTWSYAVRAVTTTLTDGPFAGPVTATTTTLLTDDLSDAIINTAKIAQGFEIVGAGTSLPANLAANDGQNLFFNSTDGKLYRWNGTAFTAAVPAADITGVIDAGQIASVAADQITGELAADQIASLNTDQLTGQIQTGQLAAGSVLTENLAVGSPTNFIWNCCCGLDTSGWNAYTNESGVAVALTACQTTTGQTGFALAAFGSGALVTVNLPATKTLTASWSPAPGVQGIPVQPGQTYGAGALVITAFCFAQAQIAWFDSSGTIISYSTGAQANNGQSGGTSLSEYEQCFVIAEAPSNAATAVFSILGTNDYGSTQNCAIIFTQAQFGPTPPNATGLGQFQPGGVTTISGGVIQTGSMNADRIISESITATQIAANTITGEQIEAESIEADNIASNSLTSGQIAANGIEAGSIAAGAIGASQIAAGAIEATALAADFALFKYEQVGLLTVNNLNVLGGSISNFFTTNGSSLTITLPANADGSTSYQSGIAIATAVGAPPGGGGGYDLYVMVLNAGGTEVARNSGFTGGGTGGVTLVALGPVSLEVGTSTTFSLDTSGGDTMTSPSISVLLRAV